MNKPRPPGGNRPRPNSSQSRRPRSKGPPRRPPGHKPQGRPPIRKRKSEESLFSDDASTATRLNEKKRNAPQRAPQGQKKSKPAPKRAAPQQQRPRKRPKAFEIRKGEYFDKGTTEGEGKNLSPLSEFSLPRSMVEEDEERAFRKKFGKDEDDDVIDIYSGERHDVVKVKHRKFLADDEGNLSVRPAAFLVVLFIIVLAAGGVYFFRDALRPSFESAGINWLPR